MKTLGILILMATTWLNLPGTKAEKQVKGNLEPIAVLELFTSQGCSSCPSADALLNKIIKENHSQKIVGLSFHVDYWNHLGWSDPYSSKQFTERQYFYHNILKADVYTPQMIVNGNTEFVGSQASEAKKNINKALNAPAVLAIDVTLLDKKLTYQLHGNYTNLVLNVAVVQTEVTNLVKKGENEGRTLTHNNVVRYFDSQKLSLDKGEMAIKIPENSSKIIVYAQNPMNGKIVGETEIEL